MPLQKIFHFGMHVVFVGRDRRKFVYSHGLPPFRLTSMIQGVRIGVELRVGKQAANIPRASPLNISPCVA